MPACSWPSRKVTIVTVSVIGIFVVLLAVVLVVTHQTGGIFSPLQNCSSEVVKCETSGDLYFVDKQKCYRKGEEPDGLCPPNMAILPVYNCRIQGQCECAYHKNNRTLIYHPDTNQCYFIYEQGFCPEGQWLNLIHGQGVCEVDYCAKEKAQDKGAEWVPFQSKCFKLYSVLDEPNCKGTLKFWKNGIKPNCSPPTTIHSSGVGAIPSAECPAGSFQAVNGRCQPQLELDF